MVKNLIQYPTPLSLQYATDVRVFNEELFSLIDDLKDTIKENNLDGLSAFQIGNYYNVIVVKDKNNNFIEMINPRLIAHSGVVTTEENTTYYGDVGATIQRYANITVVFQDRDGKDCSYKASGKEAITIQRKIDYTFGATFIQKMSKDERDKFENKLQYGIDVGIADYCPTTFKRDYILKFINLLLIGMVGIFIASFFKDGLWSYQLYTALSVVVSTVVYFFYAQYEGKKYTSCTSCQIGNIFGEVFIVFVKLSILTISSYFFIK